MIRLLSFASLGASAMAQATITSTSTYTVTQSADFAPETLVDIHLADNDLADQVFGHGCFCSKIYHWNDIHVRGGHVSVDDFDEICKNWFRVRECNDKHIGGSCKDAGVNPHASDYDYEVTQNVYDDGSIIYDCSANTEDCAYDSCVIDVEYVNQLSTWLDTLTGSFNATAIVEGDCPRSTEKVVDRFCNGTAPNLYTTKARVVATAQEVLSEYSDILESELESAEVNAEGQTCQDGTCGCSGPSARANVLFFRTTYYKTWQEAKDLCASMGLTMAEPRTTAENTLLTTGAPASWIGGRRKNDVCCGQDYYKWVWDTDTQLVWDDDGGSYPNAHWNIGEPNNAGHEPCMQMYTSGKWNDLACSNNLQVVCQQRTCTP